MNILKIRRDSYSVRMIIFWRKWGYSYDNISPNSALLYIFWYHSSYNPYLSLLMGKTKSKVLKKEVIKILKRVWVFLLYIRDISPNSALLYIPLYYHSYNPYLSLLTGKTKSKVLKKWVIKTLKKEALSEKSPTPP
jgi:hypothetical protein